MYTADLRLRSLLLLTMEAQDYCTKHPRELGSFAGKLADHEARIFAAIDLGDRLLIEQEKDIRALLKRVYDEAERLSRLYGR